MGSVTKRQTRGKFKRLTYLHVGLWAIMDLLEPMPFFEQCTPKDSQWVVWGRVTGIESGYWIATDCYWIHPLT